VVPTCRRCHGGRDWEVSRACPAPETVRAVALTSWWPRPQRAGHSSWGESSGLLAEACTQPTSCGYRLAATAPSQIYAGGAFVTRWCVPPRSHDCRGRWLRSEVVGQEWWLAVCRYQAVGATQRHGNRRRAIQTATGKWMIGWWEQSRSSDRCGYLIPTAAQCYLSG